MSLDQDSKVAYLGPRGTYSHAAARRYFGEEFDYIGFSTIDEVFAALKSQEAAHGIAPLENTRSGCVHQTRVALLQTNFLIKGLTTLKIEHCFASTQSNLREVHTIFSNPHALAQCKDWIDREMPWARTVVLPSTAEAARVARKEPSSGMIGSPEAAHLHGLNLLRKKIQDDPSNLTRFVVVARRPRLFAATGSPP